MSDARARAEALYKRIADLVREPISLMEVCGTHTMAISRFGIRSRIPKQLRLLSGPGCPVCVTPTRAIDELIAMSRQPGVLVTTFGDMMRVPGSLSSLEQERAKGAKIRVVYSPLDALLIARTLPDQIVVFMGVGFETTSPTVAATLVRALDRNVKNFYVLPAFKTVPAAMDALVGSADTKIDGFICPGHVSTIIGTRSYEGIANKRKTPCVVAGFEANDILESVLMLLEQKTSGRSQVELQYSRAVTREGNLAAIALLERVFRPCDAVWRGIGPIAGTGLELSPEFERFDARRRIGVEVPNSDAIMPIGCGCGAVMKGQITPVECALFGTACTPAHPVGPCMVSSEGACAAWHRYGADS